MASNALTGFLKAYSPCMPEGGGSPTPEVIRCHVPLWHSCLHQPFGSGGSRSIKPGLFTPEDVSRLTKMSRKMRNIFRAIVSRVMHDDDAQIEQCLRASGARSPASAGTSDGNVRRQTLPSLLTGRWLCIPGFSDFNSWFRLRRVRYQYSIKIKYLLNAPSLSQAKT